ncbi:MAG: hypothetical protein QTN59_08645 [Candidatus Electrothrix communis]|nr:MAG: hypothetical protein QTN59_08645 [Candidatus Electrothrix communis]
MLNTEKKLNITHDQEKEIRNHIVNVIKNSNSKTCLCRLVANSVSLTMDNSVTPRQVKKIMNEMMLREKDVILYLCAEPSRVFLKEDYNELVENGIFYPIEEGVIEKGKRLNGAIKLIIGIIVAGLAIFLFA